jgi:hypothetical protein
MNKISKIFSFFGLLFFSSCVTIDKAINESHGTQYFLVIVFCFIPAVIFFYFIWKLIEEFLKK